MPKRILLYTDTPLLGGAENQMYLLAKFLPRNKYAITLACSSFSRLNSWCQKFMNLGLPVQRLQVAGKHDPRHFLYLKQMLGKFDLLHLHLWNPASGRFGFLAATKTPIIITEHDPFRLTGFKLWLKKTLERRVKRIIATSQAAEKLVAQNNPENCGKLIIIPNGIDIEAWKKEMEAESSIMVFRKKHFHTRQAEEILLCVAELHERKGQKYLLGAMEQVLEKHPTAKLVLVGDGPARKKYMASAKRFGDRVMFLGARRDIAALMAAADIFVLPSRREAFGLVLLEAGIAGLPVIASRTGGIPEILGEKGGWLVPPENAEKLGQALLEALARPEMRQEKAAILKSRVEKLFQAKEMAERTAALYDEILKADSRIRGNYVL